MNERRTKIALDRIAGEGEIVFRVESKRWLKAHFTELRVGAWGIEASGDLGGYKRGTLRLPWERISELHYGSAGRGAIGAIGAIEGLYAREGEWCSRCVLPWVSEEQADEVVATIAEHHPRLAKPPESALELAVGEAFERKAFARRTWLPPLARRVVAVASPSGRA